MQEPRIKRYALVPGLGENGVRRFHLARVAERLERMEEVAARERPSSYSSGRNSASGRTSP
jgi:hypothetical protein